jgi:hypothetical protein
VLIEEDELLLLVLMLELDELLDVETLDDDELVEMLDEDELVEILDELELVEILDDELLVLILDEDELLELVSTGSGVSSKIIETSQSSAAPNVSITTRIRTSVQSVIADKSSDELVSVANVLSGGP